MTLWSGDQLEFRWQIEKVISLFSQDLWVLNLLGCWLWGADSERKHLSCHQLLVAVSCNAESFAIVFLFFLFPFHDSVLGRTYKSCLPLFQSLLPKTLVTSTQPISLETLENDCLEMIIFEILPVRAWHVMCFRVNTNGGSKRAYTVKNILQMRDPKFAVISLYLQEC